MIQRVQTVFLLLALAALGLYLWMPLIRLEAAHMPVQEFKGYEVLYRYSGYLYFVNLILAGTAAGLTLINIFLFKNRKLQVLVCWFAIIFIIAAQAFVYNEYRHWVFLGDVILRKWNLFSLVALIAELMALFYIRKDEQMIQSLDRLR